MDYQALNKVIIKNKYLIPVAAELFNQLSKAEFSPSLTCSLGIGKFAGMKGTKPIPLV